MTTVAADQLEPAVEAPGLKAGAIGFLDAFVIGLASTAPAYSLAAVIGTLVVVVGVQAPGALLVSFVPMFFIATAFYYLNRADPDAGTTFSWATRARLAAVLSTVVLLVTYVSVATAVVAFAGVELLTQFDDDDAVFGTLAGDVLGSPWDKVVILAIVTSAVASTQTTIIPASRTTFSMARSDALPAPLASVHRRFRTPHVSTAVVALLAVAWYVPANFISENFLFDTISALALMIAFYYALSGLACVVYYRRELRKSAKNLVFIGVAPLLGAGLLTYLFVEAVRSFADPEASYTGQELLGVGAPLAIGVGFLLLGAVLAVLWRLGGHERFFARKPLEAVDPAVAE